MNPILCIQTVCDKGLRIKMIKEQTGSNFIKRWKFLSLIVDLSRMCMAGCISMCWIFNDDSIQRKKLSSLPVIIRHFDIR